MRIEVAPAHCAGPLAGRMSHAGRVQHTLDSLPGACRAALHPLFHHRRPSSSDAAVLVQCVALPLSAVQVTYGHNALLLCRLSQLSLDELDHVFYFLVFFNVVSAVVGGSSPGDQVE